MPALSRTGKWIAGAAGTLVLLLALLFYTPPGLLLVGRMVSSLSGGDAKVEGLGGFFPNRLHADRVEIADKKGVWLQIEQASLRWSALALLSNHVRVEEISAARITVLRRPIPSGAVGTTPLLDIAHLSLPQIALEAPVIGHAVVLSAAGALHYTSLHQLSADLLVTRAQSSDRYRIAGSVVSDVAHGTAAISEGDDGILGKLLGLPGTGPINLAARADGDARANRLFLTLSAGPLHAQGQGTIQLADQRADMDIALAAPAMKPRPDVAWESLAGEVHFHGRFDSPSLRADLKLTNGAFAGLTAKQLNLDVTGDSGQVQLSGDVDALTLPGSHANLFARSPVRLTAQADLKAPARPVRFTVLHPLAQLRGTAETRGVLKISADLTLPSLAPFAELDGNARLHMEAARTDQKTSVTLDGRLDTEGDAIAARLLGRNAIVKASAVLTGADVTQSSLQLQGAGIASTGEGSLRKDVLNYRLTLDLKDLSRLATTLQGNLSLRGTINGPRTQASLSASGTALLATKGFARQRVEISAQAEGLPGLRTGRLTADGRLDGAPLLLRAELRNGQTRQAALTARWRSLNANADIAIGSALSGKVNLALRQLSDIAVFTGASVSGSAQAAVTLRPRGNNTDAQLEAGINNLNIANATAKTVSVRGAVSDVTGQPRLALTADIRGLAAQGFNGGGHARLDGPLDRLMIASAVDLKDADGTPLKGDAAATLNLTNRQIALSALDGNWRGVILKLDAPTTISFGNGLAVDHLAARLGGGHVTASGQLSPSLAFTASAQGIALKDFKPFLPQVGVDGTISASANLHGTLAAPVGSISLQGRNLRTAYASHTKTAALDARAELTGDHAALTASLTASDSAHMSLDGTLPLKSDGTMALRANGTMDLALLDSFLAVAGRRARGTATFNATIAGTPAAPRLNGSGKLADGEFQDYARSFRMDAITASVQADGSRIHLTQFSGRAGKGTITASGTIDLTAANMPVDMTIEADNARPIASDLITATVSGNLKLTGHLRTVSTLSGQVQVMSGEINLPENFPPEVAVLNVRRRGQPPPPPPAPESRMVLDITLRTTGPIFVRGHGLDADMGGNLHLEGTSATPQVSGGFRMNRGRYTVASQTLDFTTGRVRFEGTGLRGRIDPTLEFVAQTVSGGVTATLTVSGYASAPKITLSSSPTLPQDEIVSHLLFQQSVKQLTPLQLASIAQAAAAMGGVGGGFNPLGAVRRTLGLDRLSVGSTSGGTTGTQSQTTVEAGRYVLRNVYVGLRQNLSGGTQTQVQVDITRRLKAQATVAAGAAPPTTQGNVLQDNGSSIGLSYQFEY